MNKTRLSKLGAVVLVGGLLALGSGCIVEVDDDLFDINTSLADLQVQWTIDRSDARSMCGAYGVERWTVAVRGPEDRDVVLDCRRHYWSSEADLYALPTGSYRVTVTARDAFDAPLASVTTTLGLYGTLPLEALSFDFAPHDFY